MVATTKILPYALPEETVAAAESAATQHLIRVDPLAAKRAALIVSGTVAPGQSAGRGRLVKGFETAFKERLERLNATLSEVRFVPLHGERGAPGLTATAAELAPQTDLLILAGETAIQDRHDLAPSAIEAAGGTVICYGAPVDPGNLLLLAELGGTPVLGAPGCARSPKRNIVDLVLPRLLVGDRLTRRDITFARPRRPAGGRSRAAAAETPDRGLRAAALTPLQRPISRTRLPPTPSAPDPPAAERRAWRRSAPRASRSSVSAFP